VALHIRLAGEDENFERAGRFNERGEEKTPGQQCRVECAFHMFTFGLRAHGPRT